jgi:tetratricopeptide (TPR) repeat protein
MELLQETDVKTPELFALKSFLLLESDELEGAVKAADDGLALDERSPELWNLKGLALKRAGKLALAIEAFEEALTLAPDFADARKNMASAERDAFGSRDGAKPAKKLAKAAAQPPIKMPEPAPPKRAKGPAPVVCQECGEGNDIGAKKCSSCGAKLRYKDKEDALHREMEEAISGDLAPKKKGSKKVAQRDRESFVRELMSVPGVGYARANDIWEAGFRSEDDIHRAEMAELTRVPGVTPALARKIKKGI